MAYITHICKICTLLALFIDVSHSSVIFINTDVDLKTRKIGIKKDREP